MTPRQRIAFEYPCRRAVDTLAPILKRTEVWKGLIWSSILSVNR